MPGCDPFGVLLPVLLDGARRPPCFHVVIRSDGKHARHQPLAYLVAHREVELLVRRFTPSMTLAAHIGCHMPGQLGGVIDGVGPGHSLGFDVPFTRSVAGFTADAEFRPGSGISLKPSHVAEGALSAPVLKTCNKLGIRAGRSNGIESRI